MEPLLVERLSVLMSEKKAMKLIGELLDIAFIRKVPRNEYLELTDIGREAFLLIKVVNGLSLDSVANQLSRLRASNFYLVTHDICGCFLNIMKSRRDVEDVYICSPWIRLSDSYLADLEEIVRKTRTRMEFRIITRPPSELSDGPKTWKTQSIKTLKWFKEHNGDLVKVRKLHTKLYCVIGSNWQSALFGSENLTEAGNIELGIRVDDERMTQKLLSYFNRIYSHGSEISRDDLYVKN